MKSGRITCCSITMRSSTTAFYRYYLKPGALAQMRDSKITAKSMAKERLNLTQISLCQLEPDSGLAALPIAPEPIEGIPCFAFSFKSRRRPPRCLLRKKLIPVAPVFSES